MATLLNRAWSFRCAPVFVAFLGGFMAHRLLSSCLPRLWSSRLLSWYYRVTLSTRRTDAIRHSTPLAESITAEEVLQCSNEIYNRQGTRVVALDDGKTVVKYGHRVRQNEVAALETVARFTDIPVPRVCRIFQQGKLGFLVMSRLPGVSLETAWPSLSPAERQSVTADLAAYVQQLRSIPTPPNFIGGADLGPTHDEVLTFYKDDKGPWTSVDELNDCIMRIMSRQAEERGRVNLLCHHLRRCLFRPQPIVFTHAELHKSHILIESGRVVGLVDWEQSGFMIQSWEMCKAIAASPRDDDWLLWLEQVDSIDYAAMSSFYNMFRIAAGL